MINTFSSGAKLSKSKDYSEFTTTLDHITRRAQQKLRQKDYEEARIEALKAINLWMRVLDWIDKQE
jgi:DNA topoisomerase IB